MIKYAIAWNNLLWLSECFSQNGQTPLMLAAEQGSLEIVQELIRRGANVNLDDVVSKTSWRVALETLAVHQMED